MNWQVLKQLAWYANKRDGNVLRYSSAHSYCKEWTIFTINWVNNVILLYITDFPIVKQKTANSRSLHSINLAVRSAPIVSSIALTEHIDNDCVDYIIFTTSTYNILFVRNLYIFVYSIFAGALSAYVYLFVFILIGCVPCQILILILLLVFFPQ